MFIVHINPLTVVEVVPPVDIVRDIGLDESGHHHPLDVQTVSFAPKVNLTWESGHLRGGTPAHLINKDEYLTIFHSSRTIPSTLGPFGRITFFMGALTFSSHPPFRLLRMSSAPMIHPSFYEGAWFKRKYDYIIYPMGYVFKRIGSDNISSDNNTKTNATSFKIANDLEELSGVWQSILKTSFMLLLLLIS